MNTVGDENTAADTHGPAADIHPGPGFHTCEIPSAGGDWENDASLGEGVPITEGILITDRTGDPNRGPCPGCPGRLTSDVRYFPAHGYLIAHACADGCGYRKVL